MDDDENLFASPAASAVTKPLDEDGKRKDDSNRPMPSLLNDEDEDLFGPPRLPTSIDHGSPSAINDRSPDADLFADCTDDVELGGGGGVNGVGGGSREHGGKPALGKLQLEETPERLDVSATISDIDLNDAPSLLPWAGSGCDDNVSNASTTALRGGDTPPTSISATTNDLPFGAAASLAAAATVAPTSSVGAEEAAPQRAEASAPPLSTSATPVGTSAAAQLVKKKRAGAPPEDSLDSEPILVEHPLNVSVTDYERRGDGMSAYVVYKIFVRVPPSGVQGYSKKEYEVWRRFSDFLGLHDRLSVKHTHLGVLVPPPPEKSVVNMTKAKMSKTEEDPSQSDFLERRRAALERFLSRIVGHPKLAVDCDFRDFVTMEAELPRSSQTAALSGNNVKKMFSRLGDSFTKITYRMDEGDRWFEEKQNEIDELEESLKTFHHSIDLLVHYRRELAGNTDLFCKSLSMLASCEENTALSRAFSQLAETEEKVGLVQQDQAEKDFYILSETFRDYLALLAAVKEVLYERVKCWQRWQDSLRDLNKKREAKTRFELAARTDKLPAAKVEVIEAEHQVETSEEAFQRITKTIRLEMRRFSAQRIHDFKATLLRYLESLAFTQQQLVKYWEAFLPEAKAIIT